MAAVLAAMLCMTASCAAKSTYGSIRPSDAVTQSFKEFKVNPEYNYYTKGSGAQPKAVLGIDKKYTLGSSAWTATDMTPEKLKSIVYLVNLGAPNDSRYVGSNVLDAQKTVVGVFYSEWRRGMVLVDPEKMTVVVRPDKRSKFDLPKMLR
jgi:hypothetical protein